MRIAPHSILRALACTLCGAAAFAQAAGPASGPDAGVVRPGQPWLDSAGKPINAHGGNVLFHAGVYYWYGTHKLEGRSESTHPEAGIHAYASLDLVRWHDQGLVFSLEGARQEDFTLGCNFDRPKVVYNAKTRLFVAFFKLYLAGHGTRVGFVGVATSRSPSGPFVYQHKFLGGNSPEGTGDFAVFQEDTGELFHIAVRKPDKHLVMGKMSDDYLLPEGPYQVLEGITRATEAPALFKRDGRYWMLASASTGWAPNAARSFTATNLAGPWESLGNPCSGTNPHNGLGPELTYGGQSASILTVAGPSQALIAFFDINKPEHPYESGYIWLPITLEAGRFSIPWRDAWSPAELPSATRP